MQLLVVVEWVPAVAVVLSVFVQGLELTQSSSLHHLTAHRHDSLFRVILPSSTLQHHCFHVEAVPVYAGPGDCSSKLGSTKLLATSLPKSALSNSPKDLPEDKDCS